LQSFANGLLCSGVIDAFTTVELGFSDADIIREFGPLNETLILLNVEKHRRAAAVLRQDKRATSLLHVAYELRGVSPKFGERLDIFAEFGLLSH
jgi:hypothetical protein